MSGDEGIEGEGKGREDEEGGRETADGGGDGGEQEITDVGQVFAESGTNQTQGQEWVHE